MENNIRLENCDNHYNINDLYDKFGIDDHEVKICMNCQNCVLDGGIISCKYIVDRCSTKEG